MIHVSVIMDQCQHSPRVTVGELPGTDTDLFTDNNDDEMSPDCTTGSGSEDEDNSHRDTGTDILSAVDDLLPFDMDDILLDVDDTEVLSCGGSEGDTDKETTDGEEPAATDPTDDENPVIVEESPWLQSNLRAGCVWDRDDYSCAFDAVFMTFYSVYGQSNRSWRNVWKGESPQWNIPLSNLFDLLLSVTANDNYSPQEYSSWFSRCRDIFRDQVTESNPRLFPRGPHFAPVSDILQRILGGTSAEPCAYQHLTCPGCGAEKNDACFSLSYLGLPFNLDDLRHSQDPPILPLQLALTRYIRRYSMEPFPAYKKCNFCQAVRHVRSLHFPETSWTWFELREGEQSVLPSLEISYQSTAMQQTHTLQAIIYLGGGHFTAHVREGRSTWWGYDGQWRFGTPRLEVIAAEEELRQFGNRHPVFLIYHGCDTDN